MLIFKKLKSMYIVFCFVVTQIYGIMDQNLVENGEIG